MSDIESLPILLADEVSFVFDETCDVVVPRDVEVRPGTILAACHVLPPPNDYVVCKPTSLLDGLDGDYECCVSLTRADQQVPILDEYRLIKAAPVKQAETIVVRVDPRTPIEEGTLLVRSARAGSGLFRVVDGEPLRSDDVLYVVASREEAPSPGTVQVRAHRVARRLNAQVVAVLRPTAQRPSVASVLPKAATRAPIPHDDLPHLDTVGEAGPTVEVLMLSGEAERIVEGTVLVPCDVRFYENRKWHVYERENKWNKDKEHKLVATGEKTRRAPEDYMRIVTAVGTLPPEPPGERMDDEEMRMDDEEMREDAQVDAWASDEGVKLLEHAATPEAPPRLVQSEAADALVLAMCGADPRRTGAMEAARRLLANQDLKTHVLVRLVAGLAQQGDRPEVAYELARSPEPCRRAAAAFLLPPDHLPFLAKDPDEHVRRAAKLAADPDKFVARHVYGGDFVTAVKAIILQAAGADDDSALGVLASLWGPDPAPPEKIEEALRALDLFESEAPLSGLGESEVATHAQPSGDAALLASMWEGELPAPDEPLFEEQELAEEDDLLKLPLARERRRFYPPESGSIPPLRPRIDYQAVGRRVFPVDKLPDVTDDHPTRLDPLAGLRKVADAPRATQKGLRRNAIPLRDFASKGPRTPKATPSEHYGTSEAEENTHAIVKRATLRAIQQLECAVCGSKMTRTLDPRQAGACPIGHEWVNYRCTKDPSHLVVDRPEPMTYKADPAEEQAALQDEAERQRRRDAEKDDTIRGVVRACLAELGLLPAAPKESEPSPVTPEEARAMDEVFGPPARAKQGDPQHVGWSAREDQGHGVYDPVLRRVEPSEIPEGDDGPLGADPDDPEVQRIGQSLWGAEKEIVSEVVEREAERAQGLAETIDRKGPEAIARILDDVVPPVHHAQVVEDPDDALALMDKAFADLPAPVAAPLPEDVEPAPDSSGQQMQDEMTVLAGTGAAS